MAALSSLLVAGLAASAVGAGVSAYGQYQAGKSQQALNNYNASLTEQTAGFNADRILENAELNSALALKVGEANAAIAENNAKTAIADSIAAAHGMRYTNKAMLGANRARVGASGVVVGTGSPLLAEVANAGRLEMRALEAERLGAIRAANLNHAAALERWESGESSKEELRRGKIEADMTRYGARQQATLDRMAGKSAARAGRFGAASTILQGAGNAAMGYYGA
jgi:hypothetical protein